MGDVVKISLRCSLEQFDGLWGAAHATRRTSKTVTVDKAALEAMLQDHSEILGAAERFIDIDGIYAPDTLRQGQVGTAANLGDR
jgi:hypothetical protein